MNLSSVLLASSGGALVLAGLTACASTESAPYGGDTPTTGATATGTPTSGTATSTSGVSTSTTGAATGTTGASTTTGVASTTTGVASTTGAGGATSTTTDATSTTGGEEVFDCSNRPTVTVASMTDFEGYDGASDLLEWGFAVNDDGSGDTTLIRYMGLYDGSDMSGSPTLLMLAGNNSTYAVQAANTSASTWGGGIGFWVNCINASSFTGITLAIRGTTPTGNITFTVQEEDATGTAVSYTTEVLVNEAWTVEQFAFSSLMNEDTATSATGDNIVGLNIGAVMTWVESSEGAGDWMPEPAPYELAVDDLAFY